jgi:phosphate uptake regulator
METRKVQLTGGATYVVSLPKRWVTERGISQGDQINISTLPDGSLLLSTQSTMGRGVPRKRVLKLISERPEHLLRKLIGIYMSGYELIDLQAASGRITTDQRNTVRRFTRMVIGPEIIEESINRIIIQDFIDPTDLSVIQGIRRMYLIAKSMHKDTILALEESNLELAKDVVARDSDVNRLFWLISKQYNVMLRDFKLAEKVGISVYKCFNYLLVARIIERIGDHARKMAECLVELLTSANGKALGLRTATIDKVVKASTISLTILDTAIDALYNENITDANNSIDLVDKLLTATEELMTEILQHRGKLMLALAYIVESIRRTGLYATDISEIAINYTITELKS